MEEVSGLFFSKTRGSNRPFFCVSSLCGPLLLLAAVLPSCTGLAASTVVAPKIIASVGETVLLPCSTTVSDDLPTVEWTKEGLFPNTAFLYRDGCETFEMKNPVFRYRTNLIRHKLHHGNLSMVMSNVQLNDSGNYQCAIWRNKKKKVITRLELFVGAVSEPKFSVVPNVGGGLTLQCEAKCWFPEPLITFLDNQGNEISAEDPRRSEESPGCLTITRRVTLQTATKRVTCRVHQPEITQTRDSEMYIPVSGESLRSCTDILIITVVVTIFVAAVIAFLVKKCQHYVGRQKSGPEKDKMRCVQQSSQASGSSQSTPKPVIPSQTKSPHTISHLKPEASTNRNHPISLTQTRHSTPAVSGQNPTSGAEMKRNSLDTSAFSAKNCAVSFRSPSDSKERKRLPRSKSMRVSWSGAGGSHAPQRSNTFTDRSKLRYSILIDSPDV
ncbi:hypothetical protein ACER0C_001262 [Sarotherodon galilaeus]